MYNSLAYYISSLRKDFIEFCNKKLDCLGITQGLLFFIIYIGKHPGCTSSELSNKLKLDSGHTARSIEKLVKSEFIKKDKDIKDKRVSILNLTEKGEHTFQASYKMFIEWDKEKLKTLEKEEKEILMNILSKISNENCKGE